MTLLLASVIVLVAAFVQAASGIGFAMICVPLLALIDMTLVPAPQLMAMLALSALMAWQGRHDVAYGEFRWLVPGLLIGSLLGLALLVSLPADRMGLLFGLMILVGVALNASRLGVALDRGPLLAGSTTAGLMGTVSGIHGPALAVLYARQAPRKARATIATIFVVAAGLSLLALAWAGQFDAQAARRGLSLVPAALLGGVAGQHLTRRLPANWIRLAMLGIASVSATILIWRSL